MNDRRASAVHGTSSASGAFALLIMLGVVSVPVSGSEVALSAGLGWMADVRVGVEYDFLPGTGVRGHIGASAAGAITGDALFALRLLAPSARTALSFLVGIPNLLIPFGTNQGMVSFGGAIEGRWWLSDRFAIALRVGEGYPLFYENGSMSSKALSYPLGLWPDFFISGVVRLNRGCKG